LRLLISAAMLALFFPFFGPVVDHHFAERRHDHSHVYLGPAVPDHPHSYQSSHAHSHGAENSRTVVDRSSSTQRLPTAIVFLPTNNGMGLNTASITLPPMKVPLDFPDLEDRGKRFGFSQTHAVLQGAFVPPLVRPPRI
jgi:hypothetical protein